MEKFRFTDYFKNDDLNGLIYSKRFVWQVLWLAFTIRIICMFLFEPHLAVNELELGKISRNILDGKGFSIEFLAPLRPTASYSPFESYFHAFIHWILGYTALSYVVIIIIRSALSTMTALIVYWIAKLVFKDRLALTALCIIAFHPALIYYSSIATILNRSPYSTFLVSLSVYTILCFSKKPSIKSSMLVGILFGLSSLVQSNIMPLFFIGLVWMAYVLWDNAKWSFSLKDISILLVAVLVMIAIISPWTIRNYFVMGDLVLVRSGFGVQFWIGNNPIATGDLSQIESQWPSTFDIPPAKTLEPHVIEKIRNSSEVERDHILLRQAYKFILENPGQFLKLSIKRLRFFWIGPHKIRDSFSKKLLDYAFGIYSLISLFLIVVALYFRKDKYIMLLFLVILGFTMLYGLVQSSYYYYRMDIEPFCVLLAIFSLSSILSSYKDKLITQVSCDG
jgi:4-amino-4-deoxy-L-arabinose transferase-like glycosyltransferase